MSGTSFPPRAAAHSIEDHANPVFQRPFICKVNGVIWYNMIRAYDISCGWITLYVPIMDMATGEFMYYQMQTLFGKIELLRPGDKP